MTTAQEALRNLSKSIDTPGKRTLPRFRSLLLITASLAILLGLFILAYPFAPFIRYYATGGTPSYPYVTRLLPIPGERLPSVKARDKPIPQENRLVIPSIGVNMKIVEGQSEKTLYAGAWHLPNTSTPDRGGNTVLSGHRFQYRAGPNTLILLNKVKSGDVIIVYWQGKEYDYRVTETKIVHRTEVGILKNTAEPQLTIFTCNPAYRYNAEERLVVIAEKIDPEPQQS